ncbi:hypothetical protein Bca4012_080608 [Brassica carinata]
MIKWRCFLELVQFYGFISVEVLLDTPPGSPKNCPEAKGGSVRVQISLSRLVSFFMVKPRFFPSQDQSKSRSVQSTPFKSSLGFWPSPLRSTRDLGHIGRSHGCDGDRILPIERRNTKSPGPRFPLLEVRLWQEAKSNLVTVCLALAYIAC